MRHSGLWGCWLLAGLLAAGCMPVESRVPELTVSSDRSDALWQATAEVVGEYFPILVRRRDEGLIISDYKVGGSILEFWDQDARQPYYRLEETLQVVRRRAIARLEQTEAGYALRLQVIKERQAYRPPDAAYTSSYDLYDFTISERRDMVLEAPVDTSPVRPFRQSPAGDLVTERQDQALEYRRGPTTETVPGPRPLSPKEASLTWYRLEDDTDLAQEMTLAIHRRLQATPTRE